MKRIFGSRLVRRIVKMSIAIVMLAAVSAAFFGVLPCAVAAKIQIVPALIAFDVAAIVMFVVLAALKGRLYCEIVCPLGIAQDLLRVIFRKRVRRVCSRMPESRRRNAVKWTVFALFMLSGLSGFSFMWLDPLGIFGRGVTLTGGLFFAVLVLSLVGSGRFWCNWICPVGTVLQLISRFSVFKDGFEKCDHCEECRRCLGE